MRPRYFNLRCHHQPGCPAHLRPALDERNSTSDINRPEEIHVARAWRELFPSEPVPEVLSQPCCAQFAVSRDRLRGVPRETYARMRRWLEETPLEDGVAGRIWEYVWQYLWVGRWEVCPEEHMCYCDGFGVCMGSKGEFEGWFRTREEFRELEQRIAGLEVEEGIQVGERPTKVSEEVEGQWRGRKKRLEDDLEMLKRRALVKGMDAKFRAEECGRPWRQGDGF